MVFDEGSTEDEEVADHNQNLLWLMQRCHEHNIKVNNDKVKLLCEEVPFLGHLISKESFKADPAKIKAVREMPTPTEVATVHKFKGFTNYLSKFLLHLNDPYEKQLVTSAPVFKYFDLTKCITLQCDASDKRLGAVLLQDNHSTAYANCMLTDPETRYAQIEKELLTVIYGLEKFHTYTHGKQVTVESDHKPLEVIVKKPLHRVPKNLQRMLLRVQAYSINLCYRGPPYTRLMT